MLRTATRQKNNKSEERVCSLEFKEERVLEVGKGTRISEESSTRPKSLKNIPGW